MIRKDSSFGLVKWLAVKYSKYILEHLFFFEDMGRFLTWFLVEALLDGLSRIPSGEGILEKYNLPLADPLPPTFKERNKNEEVSTLQRKDIQYYCDPIKHAESSNPVKHNLQTRQMSKFCFVIFWFWGSFTLTCSTRVDKRVHLIHSYF